MKVSINGETVKFELLDIDVQFGESGFSQAVLTLGRNDINEYFLDKFCDQDESTSLVPSVNVTDTDNGLEYEMEGVYIANVRTSLLEKVEEDDNGGMNEYATLRYDTIKIIPLENESESVLLNTNNEGDDEENE